MQLTEQRVGNAVVLKVSGRIDHATADGFRASLQPHLAQCKAGGNVLVLDFSGVEYISSVGLRVVMIAAKQAKAQEGAIAIAAMQPVVKEIFEISKFTMVIACFSDVRDALAELSPSALATLGGG